MTKLSWEMIDQFGLEKLLVKLRKQGRPSAGMVTIVTGIEITMYHVCGAIIMTQRLRELTGFILMKAERKTAPTFEPSQSV